MVIESVLRRLAPPATDTYDAELLNRFRVERAAGRTPDGYLLRRSVLPLVARLLGLANVAVTDLGGATGDLGIEFLAEWPAARYTVVENPTLVTLMLGKSPCGFTTQIPAACDIFFTSGTLQYLDNPLPTLRAGMVSAKRYAILARNSFSETEHRSAQITHLYDNGLGPIPPGFKNVKVSCPHRTIKESSVTALAAELGFRCILRIEESSGVFGSAYGAQLVFERG